MSDICFTKELLKETIRDVKNTKTKSVEIEHFLKNADSYLKLLNETNASEICFDDNHKLSKIIIGGKTVDLSSLYKMGGD